MTVRGKKIAAVAGGAFGLAVLVCGWLVFSTGSKASKAARQLKRAAAEFGSEQAKTPVPEKTAAARSDAEACGKRAAARFEKIREMSFKREDMTIGAFQSTLQAKFAELSALEHGSQVPLVKNEPGKEFDFGFKTRSFGDADTVRLPALQRQLADTEALVNMLACSHIVQIEEIAVPKEDSAGKASETEAGGKPGAGLSKTVYDVKFTATPSALTVAINILTGGPDRFTVIESLDFEPARDAIQERVAGRAEAIKRSTGQDSRSSRRRQERQAAAQPQEIVREVAFDPKEDGLFRVAMRVAFYDYDSDAKPAAPAGADTEADQ